MKSTRKMRFAIPGLLFAAVGALAQSLTRAAAPSVPIVWFSAVDDMPAPAGFQVDKDYPQLFEPAAPWQRALSRVQVFQMTTRYVMSQPDEKLQKIFTFLREHHVALAVTFGMIPD